jgi:hypothetical protein
MCRKQWSSKTLSALAQEPGGSLCLRILGLSSAMWLRYSAALTLLDGSSSKRVGLTPWIFVGDGIGETPHSVP